MFVYYIVRGGGSDYFTFKDCSSNLKGLNVIDKEG